MMFLEVPIILRLMELTFSLFLIIINYNLDGGNQLMLRVNILFNE